MGMSTTLRLLGVLCMILRCLPFSIGKNRFSWAPGDAPVRLGNLPVPLHLSYCGVQGTGFAKVHRHASIKETFCAISSDIQGDPGINEAISSEDVLQEVLAEQGISWDDLIAMQAKSSNLEPESNSLKKRRRKSSGVSAGNDGTFRKTPKLADVRSPAAVVHMGTTLTSANIQIPESAFMPVPLAGLQRAAAESSTRKKAPEDGYGGERPPRHPSQPPPPARISTEGVTVEAMLLFLVDALGFPALHVETKLGCFASRPTVASSLKVLRQGGMEWARQKLQHLYAEERKKRTS